MADAASAEPRTRFFRHVPSLVASAVFSLAMMRNHILPLGAMPEDGVGDYGVMAWNLWHVCGAVLHGENPYWTRRIYYPVGTSLAKHTLAAGFLPVSLAVRVLSGGSPLWPVYAWKVSILLGFTLALFLGYRVLRELGAGRLASLAPVVAFAFCRYDQLHTPHIHHLAGAALLPGTTLAVLALWRKPTLGRLLVLAAVLAYGVYLTEFIVFVFMGLGLAASSALLFPTLRSQILERVRQLGFQGVLVAVFVFLVLVSPFARAWLAEPAQPPKPSQAEVTSANLAGLVVPDPDFTPLYRRTFTHLNEKVRRGVSGRESFLGFPLLLLALWGAVFRPERGTWIAAILAIFFLVLSLGPELKVLEENTEVPLPYAALRRVPPFEMARSPVRLVLPAIYALSLMAGLGLERLSRALEGGPAALSLCFASLVWVVAEAYLPVPRLPPYVPPSQTLSHLVPGAVLNVPISAWDGYAVFMQTFHGHPIATGFVSRGEKEPTDHVRQLDRLLETDLPGFRSSLGRLGINNILLAPWTLPRTRERVQQSGIHTVDLGTP